MSTSRCVTVSKASTLCPTCSKSAADDSRRAGPQGPAPGPTGAARASAWATGGSAPRLSNLDDERGSLALGMSLRWASSLDSGRKAQPEYVAPRPSPSVRKSPISPPPVALPPGSAAAAATTKPVGPSAAALPGCGVRLTARSAQNQRRVTPCRPARSVKNCHATRPERAPRVACHSIASARRVSGSRSTP